MLIIQHSVCTAYPSAALITVLRHIDVVAVFFIFCGDAWLDLVEVYRR